MPRYTYVPRAFRKRQEKRNRTLSHWEYETMGVTEEQFNELLALVKAEVKLKLKRCLSISGMLRLTLRWLREYPSYALLRELCFLHKTNIGSIIRLVIPALFHRLNYTSSSLTRRGYTSMRMASPPSMVCQLQR